MIKVFQITCINAINEKSSSILSENKKILLCLSINIVNVDVKVLSGRNFIERFLNS